MINVYEYSCVLVAQLCLTLFNPIDYSPPAGSSVHGTLQARILEWVGSHSPLQGIFLTQGSNPGLLYCRQILYCLSHQGIYLAHYLAMLKAYKLSLCFKKKNHHQTLPEVPCLKMWEWEVRVDGTGKFPLVENHWYQGITWGCRVSESKHLISVCFTPFSSLIRSPVPNRSLHFSLHLISGSLSFFFLNFIFKLHKIVLVLPNIKMNPPQVYMCSPRVSLYGLKTEPLKSGVCPSIPNHQPYSRTGIHRATVQARAQSWRLYFQSWK